MVPGPLDLTHPSFLPPGGSHVDSRLYTLRDQESYLDGSPTRPSSEGGIVFSILLQPSSLTISRFITLLYPHFTCKLIPKGNVSIFWTLVQTEILFLHHYYRDFLKGQIQSQNSLDQMISVTQGCIKAVTWPRGSFLIWTISVCLLQLFPLLTTYVLVTLDSIVC